MTCFCPSAEQDSNVRATEKNEKSINPPVKAILLAIPLQIRAVHECLNNAFFFCLSLRRDEASSFRLVLIENSSSSSKVHPRLPHYHANVNNQLSINMLQKFDIYRSHCWLIVCLAGKIRRFFFLRMFASSGSKRSSLLERPNEWRSLITPVTLLLEGEKAREEIRLDSWWKATIFFLLRFRSFGQVMTSRELVSNSVNRYFSLSLENDIDTSTYIISFLIICQAPEG